MFRTPPRRECNGLILLSSFYFLRQSCFQCIHYILGIFILRFCRHLFLLFLIIICLCLVCGCRFRRGTCISSKLFYLCKCIIVIFLFFFLGSLYKIQLVLCLVYCLLLRFHRLTRFLGFFLGLFHRCVRCSICLCTLAMLLLCLYELLLRLLYCLCIIVDLLCC